MKGLQNHLQKKTEIKKKQNKKKHRSQKTFVFLKEKFKIYTHKILYTIFIVPNRINIIYQCHKSSS